MNNLGTYHQAELDTLLDILLASHLDLEKRLVNISNRHDTAEISLSSLGFRQKFGFPKGGCRGYRSVILTALNGEDMTADCVRSNC